MGYMIFRPIIPINENQIPRRRHVFLFLINSRALVDIATGDIPGGAAKHFCDPE